MPDTPEAAKLENVLVVKIGGGAGLDVARCVDDLVALAKLRPLVVVHGVSATMDRLCAERGIEVKTITSPTGHSSRYTDAATRDVFVEAAALVGKDLADRLAAQGVNAVSLLAQGYTPVNGDRKDAIRAVVDGKIRIVRDDYSGSITGVNRDMIIGRIVQGNLPVLAPVAHSKDGLLNVDGDRAAAAVAGALGAAELVILSNVRGLYKQFPNEDSFVAKVARSQLDEALNWANGRMKRKVLGAQEALSAGVQRVIIGDGRIDNPVSAALNGAGTHFA
jgi:acetylglutamate/LysW-gamma-L-alpha-aminoadipate kinase